MRGLYEVGPLEDGHVRSEFDCGEPSLDRWLVDHSIHAANASTARVFVLCGKNSKRVAAYHAIAAGSVEYTAAPARIRKGAGRHPIPAILIARLAVDRPIQGRGAGSWMLRDALLRAVAASEVIGARAAIVHAKTVRVRGFYMRHGFEPSPADPFNLQLLLSDFLPDAGRP